MAKQTPRKKIQRKRVTFTLESPGANEVILMGDFNDWNPKTHIMNNDGEGIWRKTVVLAPGGHEYKFVVDGQWQNDPRNQDTVPNSFGTFNNVISV